MGQKDSDLSVRTIGLVFDEDVGKCSRKNALLHESRVLELPIARWRNSKRARATHEKLMELRIALE